MKGEIEPLSLTIGFVLGVFSTLITIAMTDDPVVEPPMQAHCEQFDSNLVKYNTRSFECENGARFMRYKVEDEL